MKLYRYLLALSVVWSLASCELTELDLQVDPNSPTPEAADVDLLYNSIQLNFQDYIEDIWFHSASISRMIANTGAFNYANVFQPEFFNDIWNEAYASIFSDILALENLNEAGDIGLDIHVGTAKIIKAYTLMTLVDLFGDVPNSQALQGVDVISPAPDPGDQVYADAIRLLDEAIADLTGTTAPRPNDNFYDGNPERWITLAKTLKLRAAMTTRLVDGSAAATVAALIEEGDLIDSNDEDFEFKYSSNRVNPDSRHPLYANAYEVADGDYMGNYYMWLLRGEKLDANGNTVVDPRIRFYFYRQTENSANSDENNYSCHLSTFPDQAAQPDHYAAVDPRMPYCIASDDGYWGRDHLNNQGIPPDGPLRTVYGLYPMGGQFDDNSFETAAQVGTTGALGAGIEPIMLASFVDFLRAEAALTLGTGEDAKEFLESGIRKSMEKVIGYADLVPQTMAREIDNRGDVATVEQLYKPTDEDVDAYVAVVLDHYDAATDKLDVVMKEYYIALWGNGIEAYNMYRRTGKPNNMAPVLEAGNTDFVNSLFLPAEHVNLNSSVTQKAHTEQVFWAVGGPELY